MIFSQNDRLGRHTETTKKQHTCAVQLGSLAVQLESPHKMYSATGTLYQICGTNENILYKTLYEIIINYPHSFNTKS